MQYGSSAHLVSSSSANLVSSSSANLVSSSSANLVSSSSAHLVCSMVVQPTLYLVVQPTLYPVVWSCWSLLTYTELMSINQSELNTFSMSQSTVHRSLTTVTCSLKLVMPKPTCSYWVVPCGCPSVHAVSTVLFSRHLFDIKYSS